MDDKDLELQKLRAQVEFHREFLQWLKDTAFGEEQYEMLAKEYFKDRNIS